MICEFEKCNNCKIEENGGYLGKMNDLNKNKIGFGKGKGNWFWNWNLKLIKDE